MTQLGTALFAPQTVQLLQALQGKTAANLSLAAVLLPVMLCYYFPLPMPVAQLHSAVFRCGYTNSTPLASPG